MDQQVADHGIEMPDRAQGLDEVLRHGTANQLFQPAHHQIRGVILSTGPVAFCACRGPRHCGGDFPVRDIAHIAHGLENHLRARFRRVGIACR